MRHLYTNRVVVLIAASLILAAGFFAWLRSRPATTPPPQRESSPNTASSPAPSLLAGAHLDTARGLFASDCAGCHAPGEPGRAVPPRIQRLARGLEAAPGGREYLAALLLYGASGEIPAPGGGGARRFRHPPYGGRSDDDLALLLNFTLLEPGGDADAPGAIDPYEPAEFARLRGEALTPEQTLERRPAPAP